MSEIIEEVIVEQVEETTTQPKRTKRKIVNETEEERKARFREYQRKYRQTEGGKVSLKRSYKKYTETESGKEKRKQIYNEWIKTEKGKAYLERKNQRRREKRKQERELKKSRSIDDVKLDTGLGDTKMG